MVHFGSNSNRIDQLLEWLTRLYAFNKYNLKNTGVVHFGNSLQQNGTKDEINVPIALSAFRDKTEWNSYRFTFVTEINTYWCTLSFITTG